MTTAELQDLPQVTDRAAARIGKILISEPDGSMLRIAVNGGGCSGFQYDFKITTDRNDDDIGIEKDGITVLIDTVSMDFLKGAQIDFVDDLIGQSFKIDNPNATASCGCGTSFSI
ncbi:MAG: iron-sulfur cluster insertion protein ErpA [Hyphomicrobiales bacterium]|nr:iron-sulfur cluster insertion protein ErpA [Hyphomicrobiales bacterium]